MDIHYIVRTTMERQLHPSFSQIKYELLIDTEHKVKQIFIEQLRSIMQYNVVLLEDDIILCRNFQQRIEKIIEEKNKPIINFFSQPKKYILSSYQGFAYNQCTYYSSKILQSIVRFYSTRKQIPNFTPEQYIRNFLCCGAVYTYRPCLVQHIDNQSIMHADTIKKPRRTPYFIDYLDDLDIAYVDAGTTENTTKLIAYMNQQFEK